MRSIKSETYFEQAVNQNEENSTKQMKQFQRNYNYVPIVNQKY